MSGEFPIPWEEVVAHVEKDVLLMFENSFGDASVENSGFQTQQFFQLDGHEVAHPDDRHQIESRQYTLVPWWYVGRHVREFKGIEETNREVLFGGAHIVGANEEGPQTIARYVDWADILGQIGIGFSLRPIIPLHAPS